jgi:hypothetical protein
VIRVWIQIGGEAVSLRVEVRAQSLEQAVRLAGAQYPDREAKVLFPIDPETFFCSEAIVASEMARVKETQSRQVEYHA